MLNSDQKSFEQFVREQQGPLRRFLLNLSDDATLSDDLAQEAFLKAWVALPRFSRRAKMSTWLFRIAYNCWLDNRKEVARRGVERADEAERLRVEADHTYNSDDSYRNQQLMLALDRLNESERTPLLLFYMEDKSVREIAEIMALDRSVVKMRLSRGRTHLKENLLTLGYER
ncbi:MAG: RNA polymerase sigma factor [Tidjanibacter sp.]|nr:RNA polymerase sigma factor [Tidjanibacter sp.]MBR6830901.1 RNA polymerase sigma factor [Tidjanibacter sp.]